MMRTVSLFFSLLLVAMLFTGCISQITKTASNLIVPTLSTAEPITPLTSETLYVSAKAISSPLPTLELQELTPTPTDAAETSVLAPTQEPSPTSLPAEELDDPQQKTVTVKFNDAKLISNNNVGSDWTTAVEVDGQKLSKGGSVESEQNLIKVVCTAIEKDKVSDVGTATLSIGVINLKRGENTFTVNVTVVEKGGRYAGNKAVWAFTIKVTR